MFQEFNVVSINLENDWHGVFAPSKTVPNSEEFCLFLQKLIQNPRSLDGLEVLKYSETVRVYKAKCQTGDTCFEVVCKQSLRRGGWKEWVSRWRGPREWRNFFRGLALLRAGILTARPIAFVECRKGVQQAWLVTEYVSGLADLERVASDFLPRLPADRRTATRMLIIQEVVQLFRKLDESGFHHRDLKASNILVRSVDGSDGPPQVFLVDLDGLSRRRLFRRAAWRQRIVRLTASLEGHPGVTRTDRWRFIRAVVGKCRMAKQECRMSNQEWRMASDEDRRRVKELYRKIAIDAATYAKRSQFRKTNKLESGG